MSSNLIVGLIVGVIVIVGGAALVVYGLPGSSVAPATTGTGAADTSGSTATTVTTSTTTTTSNPAIVTPTPVTRSATGATASTAVLHGTITSGGATTTYWFEYSSDPLLGAVLNRTTAHTSLAASAVQATVLANISGLMKSTKYYYRVVAQNSVGTVKGAIVSFNTK